MLKRPFFLKLSSVIALFLGFGLTQCNAAGIVLGETRIVYPTEMKQVSIPARNSSKNVRYMVQSWVEDVHGVKSNDFIVTPPVYISNANDENILRIMYTNKALPTDRETLFYFNTKAVPAIDKNANEGKNQLILASVTRIKLFMRPSKLSTDVKDAPHTLEFKRNGQFVTIENPSPYYVTLVNIKGGASKVKSLMVPPKGVKKIIVTGTDSISYQAVNDYGGTTPEIRKSIN